jgi:glutamate formiminotransferase
MTGTVPESDGDLLRAMAAGIMEQQRSLVRSIEDAEVLKAMVERLNTIATRLDTDDEKKEERRMVLLSVAGFVNMVGHTLPATKQEASELIDRISDTFSDVIP